MKKFFLMFIMIFSLFGFTSCNQNKEKIILEGQEGISEAIDLYPDQIMAKKNSGDSFLLFGYLPTCQYCKSFEKIYNNYISENQVVLYKTFLSDLMVVEKSVPNRAPIMVIYRDGELSEVFTYSKYKDIFSKSEEFNSFMDKYFIKPTMYSLTFDQLDTHLNNKESMVVYFGWKSCGDCSYMNDAFLSDFLKENKKKFYYVETDEVRKDKEEHPEIWEAFCKKYGFYSYNGGRIPAIVYYEQGECKDFAIYFNDQFVFNDDDSVKVVGSYYEDYPYLNKTFASYNEYQEQSESFYNQKIKEFFNQYL